MNRRGNAAVIVLVLLLVVSLGIGAYGFISFQKEKQQRIALEDRINDLEVLKKKAEEKLEQAKQQIDSLSKDIAALKVESDDLKQVLDSERKAKEDILNQNMALKKESEQQKANLVDLQAKLSSKEKEAADIQKRLNELQAAKEELEKKATAVVVPPEGVNLEKIVVEPAGKGAKPGASVSTPKGPLQGKVLVVNKEYKFAVINLGKNEGVKIGDVFTVSRSGKKLGQIKVAKVHDTMSAADFLDAKLMDLIKEDDSVIKK